MKLVNQIRILSYLSGLFTGLAILFTTVNILYGVILFIMAVTFIFGALRK